MTEMMATKIPFDPVCYAINSISMGDVIASAPIVKWAIENLHPPGVEYTVLVYPQFQDFFEFVPKERMKPYGIKHEFPLNYMLRYLNTLGLPAGTARNTSMRMHLSQFASLKLTDRLINPEFMSYLPLREVPIDHLGVDLSRAVLIVVTHRDEVRQWPKESVTATVEWLLENNYQPVYIGKIDNDPFWKDSPLKATFDPPAGGLDLRNKTSILELATLMKHSRAVMGVDSGPIHLAATTEVPIICGYTTVAPEHRIPLRKKGKFFAISPNIGCQFCQSFTNMNYHDYGKCYLETIECCSKMTADKFIAALKQALD